MKLPLVFRGPNAPEVNRALASRSKQANGVFQFHVDKTGAAGMSLETYKVPYFSFPQKCISTLKLY